MPKAMRPPVSPNIAPLPVNDLLPDPTATEVNIACYEAFLVSRLLSSFLTIEFALKRPDFRLHFFDHFYIRRH
jgi:hypothetical protein